MAEITGRELLAALDEELAPENRERLDPDKRYEEIDGQLVEMPPGSAFAQRIASRLLGEMYSFAWPRGLGEPVVEVLFHFPDPVSRNRRPDLAFVSAARAPLGQIAPSRDNAWDVVPDLAVEVVSPHDVANDQMEKVIDYFRAGVRLVWVIYPELGIVVVHESAAQSRHLTRDDTLDGGAVVPGFSLALATLLPQAVPTP